MLHRGIYTALPFITAALFSCSQAVDIDTCRDVEDPYTLVLHELDAVSTPSLSIEQDGDRNGTIIHELDIRHAVKVEVDTLRQPPTIRLSLAFARRDNFIPDRIELIDYILDSLRIETAAFQVGSSTSLRAIGPPDSTAVLSGFGVWNKIDSGLVFLPVQTTRDSAQFLISTKNFYNSVSRLIECEFRFRSAFGGDSLTVTGRFDINYAEGTTKTRRICKQ